MNTHLDTGAWGLPKTSPAAGRQAATGVSSDGKCRVNNGCDGVRWTKRVKGLKT